MQRPQTPPDWIELAGTRSAEMSLAFSDPNTQEVIQDAATNYRHWDKLRRIAADRGVDPEIAWACVKLGRRSNFRNSGLLAAGRQPLLYNVPDPLQHEMMLMDQELAGNVGVESRLRLGPERDRFIISSLWEEAIASSMLEGAATTVIEAREMLRTGRAATTRGERMVLNNYRAIEMMRDNLDRQLSPGFLLELHSILTEDTLDKPDEVGRFRREDERVVVQDPYGEVLHDPPPASELNERVRRLCEFANADVLDGSNRFTHPFIRASLLHFQIGFDHPFCDGNGRTARAIFYWSMLRAKYWLFEFLPISRLIYRSPSQYGRAYLYTETDAYDATYFLLYHADIVKQARTELRQHIERKQNETRRVADVFRSEKQLNHRQRALLGRAIEHPDETYTIESHQRSHSVAYATARSDLIILVQKGLLSMERRGRTIVFHAGRRTLRAALKLRSKP